MVGEFLYDLQTAGLAGRRSTGSAHRSLSSQPQIAPNAAVMNISGKTVERDVRLGTAWLRSALSAPPSP